MGPPFYPLKKHAQTHKQQISPGGFLVYLKVQYI